MPAIQGKIKFLLMAVGCFTAMAHASVSRLSSGRWAEVAVDSTGMQEISYDQLRSLGFDNPGAVRVYGYGQAAMFPDNFTDFHPDDLPQQPVMHRGGRLLFYGEAPARVSLLADSSTTRIMSPYSFESRYFLSDIAAEGDDDGLTSGRIEPSGDVVDSHAAIIYIERERFNPSGHGTGWYDTTISSSSPATYTLRLEGLTREWRPRLSVRSVSIDAGTPSIALTVANSTLTQTVQKSSSAVFITQTKRLPADGTESLTAIVTTSATSGFVATDWLTMLYPRANSLGDRPQQIMAFAASHSGRPIKVGEGVEVWDVTSPAAVRRMPVAGDGIFAFADSGQPWHQFVAFNPDAVQISPRVIGSVGNQDLHAMDTPQMLVITTAGLLDVASTQMQRLHPDLDVLTVDATAIYREFGSGVKSAPALRRFIKMLHDQSPDRLKYILLIGDVSQDNRGIDRSAGDIPTFQSDIAATMHDTTLSFWSTAYYACVSDSYNAASPYFSRPSMAVGLIPAGSVDQLQTYLTKLEQLTSAAQQRLRSRHDVMLVNDFGDNGLYTSQADVHDMSLRAGLDNPVVHKVYSDVYTTVGDDMPLAREAFVKATEQYPSYMLYIGHGEYNFITSGSHWLQDQHLATMQFPTVPLMVLSTCRTCAIDLFDSALGAELIFNRDNGAGAVIGNSRFSLSNYNQRFACCLTDAWIDAADAPVRVGDLWLTALNNSLGAYVTSIAGSINTHKYILIGDPAMPLPTATASITAFLPATVVQPVSGDMISGRTDITVGKVEATAYADDAPTYLNGTGDTSHRGQAVANNNRRLWSATATISGGLFSLPLNMPAKALDSDAGLPFHIVVKAWSDDDSQVARTSISGLTLKPAQGAIAPPVRPISIVSMLTDPEGHDIASGDVTVTAAVDGGSAGLARLDGRLQAPVRLMLDGVLHYGGEIDSDGENHTVTYRLEGLSDGRHRAELHVTDNAGTTDSMAVEFTVIDRSLDVGLSVNDTIVHDEVVVTVDADTDLDECRLIITDFTGETVLSLERQPGEWTWSLLDSDGQRVAPGNYTLRVMARSARRHAATAPVVITVLPR